MPSFEELLKKLKGFFVPWLNETLILPLLLGYELLQCQEPNISEENEKSLWIANE